MSASIEDHVVAAAEVTTAAAVPSEWTRDISSKIGLDDEHSNSAPLSFCRPENVIN